MIGYNYVLKIIFLCHEYEKVHKMAAVVTVVCWDMKAKVSGESCSCLDFICL